MERRRGLTCEARDGVALSVDVYLPDDADEPVPALLALSPYGKELQALSLSLEPQPRGRSPVWDGCIEAGDIRRITDHGYAHVVADLRGTGHSDGEYAGIFGADGEDGHDLVEWAADQPWCSGRVGMVGRSWFGTNQLLVAAERPPSLEAVFPAGVFTDLYRDFAYHGGVLSLFMYGLYGGRDGDSGFAARNVASKVRADLGEEAFRERCRERLEDPDVRAHSNLYHLLNYPYENPAFVDLLLNPTDGAFYAERSPASVLSDIECPVYLCGAWGGTHAGPSFDAYRGIDAPKKLLMVPSGGMERPFHEYHDEMFRWFDHHLRDVDTGVMDEPPVTLHVEGGGAPLRGSRPLPEGTRWRTRYLRSFGRLSTSPAPTSGAPSSFAQDPPTVTAEAKGVRFRAPPFEEWTVVLGPAEVRFHAAIDAADTNWIVLLRAVDGSGGDLLARGYLRASHRAVDEERSRPGRPHHPHRQPEPVVEGEVYEYRVGLPPIARAFGPATALEVEIRSMEVPFRDETLARGGLHYHLPRSVPVAHRVYHDAERPSQLRYQVLPSA